MSFLNLISFDINSIVLDTQQNDKNIKNNAPSLLEKIQLQMLTGIIFVYFWTLQFVQSLIQSQAYLQQFAIESIIIILVIFVISKSKEFLYILTQDKKTKNMTRLLQIIQIQIQLLIMITNIYMIFWISFWDVQFIIFVFSIVYLNLYSNYLVSNLLKISAQTMIQLILIIYTIKSMQNQKISDLQYVKYQLFAQELLLHIQNIVSIISTIIQIKVIGASHTVRRERVQLSFETMHDLRNYLQSQIELSNKDKEGDDENEHEQDNKELNLADSVNHAEQSLDFENKEAYYHQKFILFKICFLYHMELIFENMYNLRPAETDVKEMLMKACHTLKVLFMNKNNEIRVDLTAAYSHVTIEPINFEQLIVELARMLHNMMQEDIVFKFNFQILDDKMMCSMKILLPNMTYSTQKDIKHQNVISKLITSLNIGAKYHIDVEKDSVLFLIDLNCKIKKETFLINNGKSIMNHGETIIIEKIPENHNQNNDQQNIKKSSKKGSGLEKMGSTTLNRINSKKESDFNKVIRESIEPRNYKDKPIQQESWKIKKKKELVEKIKFMDDINILTAPENKSKEDTHKNSDMTMEKITKKASKIKHKSSSKALSTIFDKIDRAKLINLSKKQMDKEEVVTLLENQNPVTQKEDKDGLIQINVDDEENILRMNSRICKKENVELNCVKSGKEFMNLLLQIFLDYEERDDRPSILSIMDHMLDREQGWEAVQMGNDISWLLNLDITFVLLSSTEDKETLDKYTSRGVKWTLAKPMNKAKFKSVNDPFRDSWGIVGIDEIPDFNAMMMQHENDIAENKNQGIGQEVFETDITVYDKNTDMNNNVNKEGSNVQCDIINNDENKLKLESLKDTQTFSNNNFIEINQDVNIDFRYEKQNSKNNIQD